MQSFLLGICTKARPHYQYFSADGRSPSQQKYLDDAEPRWRHANAVEVSSIHLLCLGTPPLNHLRKASELALSLGSIASPNLLPYRPKGSHACHLHHIRNTLSGCLLYGGEGGIAAEYGLLRYAASSTGQLGDILACMISVTIEEAPILVDLDNVTFDHDGAVLAALNAQRETSYYPAQLGTFYIQDQLPQYTREIQEIVSGRTFFIDLEPLPFAVDAIRNLQYQGFDVRFCSSPQSSNPTCEEQKRESIARHFDEQMAAEAIIQKDKTVVDGLVLVDDRPEITGANTSPSWQRIVFDRTCNRHIENAPRMQSWAPGLYGRAVVYYAALAALNQNV